MKHKALGQVFTPDWIVLEILDLVGYIDSSILNKYILEPSSGDGVFLLEIVRRYINIALSHSIDEETIITNLEKYIYAVEIDELEYDKSIKNLDNLVSDLLSSEIKVQWKFFHQNTLNFYKDYQGFFDIIVGNPPYIRIHNLDLDTRAFLKENFVFSSGTIDLYLCFFEMSFDMAKKDGFIGFITPNSYLHNSSYKLFRNYLKEKSTLKTLIDFKAHKIFKGFSTYTAISIFDKHNTQDSFEYKEYLSDKIETINQVKFELLDSTDWSFATQEDEKFLQQIDLNKSTLVKDFFDVQYGFATLRDKIFIAISEPYDDTYVKFNGHLVEKEMLKNIVKGSKFKGILNENEFILFPYELIGERYKVIPEHKMQEKFPKAYEYLLLHKEELLKRDIDKNALWYEFGRSQGVQNIHKEKIVLSTLVNGSINFYKLPKEVMVYSGLFIVKNKEMVAWKIIEDLLKSDEFYRYIRLTGKDFSGGYKSITSKQVKEYRLES